MFKPKASFSGLSAKDLPAVKEFYANTLGLTVDDGQMGLHVHLPHGAELFIYEGDHKPAEYTCLDFVVDDIDEAVDALTRQGVTFERYEGYNQDEKGIARGKSQNMGPDIAWFKDPAGHILAVLES